MCNAFGSSEGAHVGFIKKSLLMAGVSAATLAATDIVLLRWSLGRLMKPGDRVQLNWSVRSAFRRNSIAVITLADGTSVELRRMENVWEVMRITLPNDHEFDGGGVIVQVRAMLDEEVAAAWQDNDKLAPPARPFPPAANQADTSED